MSKGLEELKRMAYENACCRCQYYIDKKCTNNYECVWKTIEKELKEKETQANYIEMLEDRIDNLETTYLRVRKALEIIRNKNFDLFYLQDSKDLEMYNDACDHYRNLCYLTQEEYDLLKEVLI